MTCSLELLNTTRGLRTPKHGGCYLMDGGVADTACHTQAVVLLELFNTTRKLSGPLSRTVVSPFRRRRKHRSNAQEPWFATHRTTTLSMVRKVQRNSHPKPIWDHLSALMVLSVKCRQSGPARPAEIPVVRIRHQIHYSGHVSGSSVGSSVGSRPSAASGSPRAGASLGARARALVALAEQSAARPRS